jgi:hypothetical protein
MSISAGQEAVAPQYVHHALVFEKGQHQGLFSLEVHVFKFRFSSPLLRRDGGAFGHRTLQHICPATVDILEGRAKELQSPPHFFAFFKRILAIAI